VESLLIFPELKMTSAEDPISQLTKFVQQRIVEDHFPGAVFIVYRKGQGVVKSAQGLAVVRPKSVPMKSDTIFDLSSLTKPLTTALLAVLMAKQKTIRLEDEVGSFLPELSDSPKRELTLIDLLTHRAGFPDWLPLYLFGNTMVDYLHYLNQIPLLYPPRKRVVYSCIGYIILGEILSRVAGVGLDELALQLIIRPLKLTRTMFRPPSSLKEEIAATEDSNRYERERVREYGIDYKGWREVVVWGEVHDQNAFSLGGIGGNAGLFSSADDLLRLATQLLPEGEFLPSPYRELFYRNFTPGLEEDRAIGWQLACTPGCSAGDHLHPTSIGHTGFTGTSLWIDPQTRTIYILLTNRIHPHYRGENMNQLRRDFHRLASQLFT